MNHLNNDPKNELSIITTSYEENEELYEKAAEMVLTQSIVQFQKEQLLKQIDHSLSTRDKNLFMKLTEQYNTLLSQHRI